MTPQELKEELIAREWFGLGYQQGARDTILSISKKEEQNLINSKKEEFKNGHDISV